MQIFEQSAFGLDEECNAHAQKHKERNAVQHSERQSWLSKRKSRVENGHALKVYARVPILVHGVTPTEW